MYLNSQQEAQEKRRELADGVRHLLGSQRERLEVVCEALASQPAELLFTVNARVAPVRQVAHGDAFRLGLIQRLVHIALCEQRVQYNYQKYAVCREHVNCIMGATGLLKKRN